MNNGRTNYVRIAACMVFVLANIYRLYYWGEATIFDWGEFDVSYGIEFNEERCARAIILAVDNIAGNYEIRSISSSDQAEDAIHHTMAKVVLNSTLRGDFVAVDLHDSSSPTPSNCIGMASHILIAAIAQRTALIHPSCKRPSNATIYKRAIWYAYTDVHCTTEVMHLFESWGFSILGSSDRSWDKNIDVPIRLLPGQPKETLPDSFVENIAFLEIKHPPVQLKSEDLAESNSLHALFSLHRRVSLGGYIALDGVWLGGVKEFFLDSVHNVTPIFPFTSKPSAIFMKEDNQIRVPGHFRKKEIASSIGSKVIQARNTLDQWHKETGKSFFGHVMTNPYQTYRYTEAMRHVVHQQMKRNGLARVNVCETGFNGGHSAMLFMSFLDKEDGIAVNYYGWDLKEVGSAVPTAKKMTELYPDNFNIVWGDSHVTLKQAKEVMHGQLCHLIVVDGDHSKRGVIDDINNFLKVAAPGAIVFGDDCAPYQRMVPKSQEMLDGWMEFVHKKQLISVANYRNPDMPSPGFVEGLVPQEDGSYTLGL